MPSKKPLTADVVTFAKHHLGKDCFAPLTGQDWPAWNAFVYLLQCYSHGGGDMAISAMHEAVRCTQMSEPVLQCFVQAIPAVLDWTDVARLWPKITGDLTVRRWSVSNCDGPENAAEMRAIERWEGPGRQVNITTHGWSPTHGTFSRSEPRA